MFQTLQEVREAIKDKEEFYEVEKDGLVYVNYHITTPTSFSNPDLKDCRGICFDGATGTLLQRKLHKFFNFGEPLCDVTLDTVQFPLVFYTKWDGSMLTILKRNGTYQYNTKMGRTDVAKLAEYELPIQKQTICYKGDIVPLTTFIDTCIQQDETPIFEYISPRNNIVISYDKAKLILLMVRNNKTGKYTFPEQAGTGATVINNSVAGTLNTKEELTSFINTVSNTLDIEGFVVWDAQGRAFKLKSEDYFRKHALKEGTTSEYKLWELILTGTLDDTIAVLQGEYKAQVETYAKEFSGAFFAALRMHLSVATKLVELLKKGASQKDIALEILKHKNVVSGVLFSTIKDYKQNAQPLNELCFKHLKISFLKATTTEKRHLLKALFGIKGWNVVPLTDE